VRTLWTSLLLGTLLAGCRGPQPDTVTVLAAASLTEAFGEIGAAFEAAHPGVRVRLSLGPSSGLATQIVEGAPADVFASASPRWVEHVAERVGVLERAPLVRNRLVVITPADDPGDVASFGDLARPGVRLVLAAPGVPAGDYAREALERAGLADAAAANEVSREADVRGVLQRVRSGEADAGIVYRTDVSEEVAGDVRQIDLPEAAQVEAEYVIAVPAGAPDPELARAFVAFARGPEGQATLDRFGFETAGESP
jgi:molybdate transport system substrate-binding protein